MAIKGINRIDRFEEGDELERIGTGQVYTVLKLDPQRGVVSLRSEDGAVSNWRRQHWRGKFKRHVKYTDVGGGVVAGVTGYEMYERGEDGQLEICEVRGGCIPGQGRVVCRVGNPEDGDLVVAALNAFKGGL